MDGDVIEFNQPQAERLRDKIRAQLDDANARGIILVVFGNRVTYSFANMGAGEARDHLMFIGHHLLDELNRTQEKPHGPQVP